jgi:hypothetical protein
MCYCSCLFAHLAITIKSWQKDDGSAKLTLNAAFLFVYAL